MACIQNCKETTKMNEETRKLEDQAQESADRVHLKAGE